MNLIETYRSKKYKTDKNTAHCYIEKVYNDLFDKNATNVLEIGAFKGGSALLWRDYFSNALIDIIDVKKCEAILGQDRINHIIGDAYSTSMLSILNTNLYDIIIDDGPHSLNSMIFFVKNYISFLKPNGIAIIEDVQKYSWFEDLLSIVPENFHAQILDFRKVKNRCDDMLLLIKRGSSQTFKKNVHKKYI